MSKFDFLAVDIFILSWIWWAIMGQLFVEL